MASIIDSHVHCGRLSGPSFQEYLTQIKHTAIKTAVFFSSVAEIYDRIDPEFEDNAEWQSIRKQANEHILSLANANDDFRVYPYFFVWNDFAVEQTSPYLGVKWHRHDSEPHYDYDSPKCREFIAEVQRRHLPVVLEEEFDNTLFFINELAAEATVIIPHCGLLNGGYWELCKSGVWEKPNVYADTALANPEIIDDYVSRYGHEKIFFGSDFPFGDPVRELEKVLNLEIPKEAREAILGLNIVGLLENVEK
jgi:predicted TIM-barrel fold metal-dependent hydrolase